MKTRVLTAIGACLLVLCPPTPGSSQHALSTSDEAKLEQAALATTELRVEEAERLLLQVQKVAPDAPNVLHELSRVRFHQGRYAEALSLIDQALDGAPDSKITERWRAFRALIEQTLTVTRDYQLASSPDRRYLVLYPEGKDRVLAEYALHVLAAADAALEAIFATRLPGPIRLEIYPSAETLAQVSALTVEQIQTTGTVALSKWNRLMITSPKALLRGYPWADTITHELVHMVLSRVTGDNAPVWLQEGTAKLFERVWRVESGGLLLDPASRVLLHAAKRDDKLLTFEQMHPSIAMLPSQDDAALAFAQVATFMDRYVERFGRQALRAGLDRVRQGTDARAALSAAAGVSFAQLEGEWKSNLPTLSGDVRSLRRLRKRFVTGETPPDDTEDVEEAEARRFLRIADLLWDRGRTRAAAVEYKKAHSADPDDPIVAARWGRAALDSGDAKGAVESLAPHAQRYPGHAPTHAILGQALLLTGDHDGARRELREAIWINPFDPTPHCALAKVPEDPAEAEREASACAALSR